MEGSNMSAPLRVALVGTGGISRAHATACMQTDRAELVAVTDVSQDSIDRFVRQFPVEHMYLELDRMLANEEIDIVVICTWGVFHAEVGKQLAQSKKMKAILCEKPFTQTAAQASQLVDVARDNGILIAEAFKFRHHPMHLKAKEIVDSGEIGDLMTVRSTFCTSSGAPVSDRKPELNWRWNKEKGGGSIFDLACYNIHHARWTFGADPVEVFATQRPGIEVDDGANIQLVFPNGGIAQITVGFDTYQSQDAEILGTTGSLRTDRAWNNENRPVWLDQESKGLTRRHHIDACHQFTLQLEHMCDVVEGKTEHRVSPENSIGQMKTIDAIYESFKTRKAVNL
jgi:D-xylose 1-dehydrogenase (NADP+, D-xylono-1,5-lactone-forming)